MKLASVFSGVRQGSSFSRAGPYTYFAKLLQLTYREAAQRANQSPLVTPLQDIKVRCYNLTSGVVTIKPPDIGASSESILSVLPA